MAFIPMVVEAHGVGGMSRNLRTRWDEIARRQRCTGVDCEGVEPGLFIAQRFSICLQAENARANWRRLPQEAENQPEDDEERWDIEGDESQDEEMEEEDRDGNGSEGRSPGGDGAAGEGDDERWGPRL